MPKAIFKLQEKFEKILTFAIKRPKTIKLVAWGKEREFECYDFYDDTFIFEVGIWQNLQNKDSVVFIPKSALCGDTDQDGLRVFGNIMTISSGNHAVTTLPLLAGKFWDIPAPPEDERPRILSTRMVCANIVNETFEISQREVSTPNVVEMDDWLQALGCPMNRIVMIDRTDSTLEHYSRCGQEWRIKPLVWTRAEMDDAIRASLCRRHSLVRYYHNVKGAHFLTLPNLLEWGALVRTNYPEFLRGLNELAANGAETKAPNLTLPKYGGHHEIELFGLPPGFAEVNIVPLILNLRHRAVVENCPPEDTAERFAAIAETFRASLTNPALADDTSPLFVETLYRNITGAVYFDGRETNTARAFDDMRTALPGATYMLGSRTQHEGVDPRSIAILDDLEQSISHGDTIEYVNIYELRSLENNVRLGEGRTREIVYKTNWSPLPYRAIEKRLAQKSTGYGAYTIVRVHAFRMLGIAFGKHKLLARNDGRSGEIHFFTRNRYPGDPFDTLPEYRFHDRDPLTGKYDTIAEAPDIVRVLITLMGSAAAENMILKKLTPDDSIRYAEGKEIVEFGYDVRYGKEMPLRVWLCSVRGTMGWRNRKHTEENVAAMFTFYMRRYAQTAFDYSQRHSAQDRYSIADAFFAGFASRTREICWNYTSRRSQFDTYKPNVFGDFHFADKWEFILWTLELQRDRMNDLGKIFHEEFSALCENADAGAPADPANAASPTADIPAQT